MGPLVLPPRLSDDSTRIAVAAVVAGVPVLRLPGWRVPDGTVACALYAEPLYADVVSGPLGLALLEAPLDWLVNCPAELSRRPVRATTLAWARTLTDGPVFVKAADDKSVPPAVYATGADLPNEQTADGTTLVLVQGVIRFTAEYRLFCLDRQVTTGSRYAVYGTLDEAPLDGPEASAAVAFAVHALTVSGRTLPRAAVLDVGLTCTGDWAVVEANAPWGSGLYAVDEHLALPVVLAGSKPRVLLDPAELPFVRKTPDIGW